MANVSPLDPKSVDRSAWDKRPDGSTKGFGYLGVLARPDGGVSSEISVGVNLGGQDVDIPTMVPGLDKSEVHWLLTTPTDQIANKLPGSILRKAVEHAKMRLRTGKSPFKQDDE